MSYVVLVYAANTSFLMCCVAPVDPAECAELSLRLCQSHSAQERREASDSWQHGRGLSRHRRDLWLGVTCPNDKYIHRKSVRLLFVKRSFDNLSTIQFYWCLLFFGFKLTLPFQGHLFLFEILQKRNEDSNFLRVFIILKKLSYWWALGSLLPSSHYAALLIWGT